VNLTDSHAHLNHHDFQGDLSSALERAAAAGVDAILVPGYDLSSSRAAVALAERFPQLWAAVGVHPHDATSLDAEGRRELARLATHPRVVAVGETGLDYYRMLSPKEVQQEALRFHLDLAAEAGRPVILHERETRGDLVRVLSGRQGLAGVWHCFSADLPAAGAALDLGLYLGLAGPLAFPRSDSLRETATKLPLDRILLETDSPYLAPPPHRGRRNEPAHVRVVAEMLARVRQMPLAEIARRTTENVRRLFPEFAGPRDRAEQEE